MAGCLARVLRRRQKIRLGFNPADHGLFHHNLPSAYSNPNRDSADGPVRMALGSRGVDPSEEMGPFEGERPIPVALSRRHSNLARDRSQR
ncbi:MAG: hypothetical protein QOH78_2574 [Verrucomicrobiota bacterium]